MTFAEAQHKYGTSVAGLSITTTFTNPTVAGNVLVAMAGGDASTTLAISGWTAMTPAGTGPVAQFFWKRANGTETAVLMSSTASVNLNLDLFELSGFAVPFAPVEMTAITGTGVASLASNNLVTVRASSVVMFAVSLSAASTGAFSFTNSVTGGDLTLSRFSGGYRLNVAAGTYTTTASWTTSRNAAMAGIEFVSSGGLTVQGEAIAVEVGFGSTWKTADASVVWTDTTPYTRHVEGISTSRGRRSLQETFATGTADWTFNNETRLFDTLYSSGTFFGQLKPGVPYRIVSCPAGQSMRHISRGFISGFPQRYDVGNTLSVVPVSAYGVFDKLARAKLPQSAVDVEVLADTPVAYWKLDDNTEAEMLDSSGNDHHGTYDNPTLQQDALVEDGGKAVFFDNVGDHRGKFKGDLVTAFPLSIEAWVEIPRNLTQYKFIVATQRDASLTARVSLMIDANAGLYASTDGAVIIEWFTLVSGGTNRTVSGATAVDDGLRHHIVASLSSAASWSLYIDGVAESLTSIFAGTPGSSWSNMTNWVIGNSLDYRKGDFGIDGVIDNVAIYASALSSARVLAHYNSGISPWDGDTPDVRLGRVLDVIGLPADRRSFEVCTTMLGSTVLGQQRALDYMRKVEASEDGRMFETADGKVRFLNRYWGITDTHATSSQATFSDTGSISYRDLEIDPDDELLVNICTITRESAAALTVTNQTSVNTYGPADTSIDVLLQTDAEARSLAEHVVLVRGTPAERVSKLRVPLHKYTGAQQAAILDLEIGYQITVNRTPQGVGSAMALSLIVEGIDHTITLEEHWVEFNVSVAPAAGNYFIWGVSTWDQTTTWGW